MNNRSKLFDIQKFSDSIVNSVIENNLLIDYYFGNEEIVKQFVLKHPIFLKYFNHIQNLKIDDVKKKINIAKKQSLLMVVLMLTGKCNADCSICYTDRKEKNNELSFSEIKQILDQSKELGAKTLYIPGEGEPTLDKNFWAILEYCNKISINVILFTNGILFSNSKLSQKHWGISNIEAIKRIEKLPVYIYFKLWSLNSKTSAAMMNIKNDIYNYVYFDNYLIPEGLVKIINTVSPNKIGIETVIEKRNYIEVINEIIPFVQKYKLHSYVENLLHSGRCYNNYDNDAELSKEEELFLDNWVQRKKCERISYMFTLNNNGRISNCMALSPKQINNNLFSSEINIRMDNSINNLFSSLHSNSTIVKNRYKIDGCLCEIANNNVYEKKALTIKM